MSSLQNLLNPEIVKSSVESDPEQPSTIGEASLSSNLSGNTSIECSREEMGSKDHETHPDCPDTLACLPDTDGRPQHTLPVILRCAILGSPRKRLTIREIYAAMEEKYSYYKTAGPTWKQSVRHHLSLNRLFERQPRPVTDPGFGSYWTVNLMAPPGTKRPRKRGRPNKDVLNGSGSSLVKRRGRPRKDAATRLTAESPKRMTHDVDVDDEMLTCEEDVDGSHISEEEYESEEDMIHPFDRHPPVAGMSAFETHTSSSSSSQQITRFSNFGEGSDHIIDRLQIEIAGLRRQSTDAVSLSLRMSDQLAEAQSEASRARAALKTAESMLEDEARKRREAEKVADDEARRRRAAEDALRALQI